MSQGPPSPAPTVPDRPAPTQPDDDTTAADATAGAAAASEAVADVLERSRATAVPLELAADMARVGGAAAFSAAAWTWISPRLEPWLPALAEPSRTGLLALLLVLAAGASSTLLFRLTSRRFCCPLGRAR